MDLVISFFESASMYKQFFIFNHLKISSRIRVKDTVPLNLLLFNNNHRIDRGKSCSI